MAESAAREETATGRMQTQALLRILKDLVKGMAKASGERTIVVMSPRFFVAEDSAQVDVLDDAARDDVHGHHAAQGIDPNRFLCTSLSDMQESAVDR